MSARCRIGVCTLCACAVYRAGTNGKEMRRNGKPRWVEHHHREPYTIDPAPPVHFDRSDDDEGEYRYWHDHVPSFVR